MTKFFAGILMVLVLTGSAMAEGDLAGVCYTTSHPNGKYMPSLVDRCYGTGQETLLASLKAGYHLVNVIYAEGNYYFYVAK